jgi:hypothetical protein
MCYLRVCLDVQDKGARSVLETRKIKSNFPCSAPGFWKSIAERAVISKLAVVHLHGLGILTHDNKTQNKKLTKNFVQSLQI